MTKRRANILFVVLAYAFFWALLVITYLIFSNNDQLFPIVVTIDQVVGSWAPTVALIIMFKKLHPGMTAKAFFRNAFSGRLNLRLLIVVTVALLLAGVAVAGIQSFATSVSITGLFNISILGVMVEIFSGATGEEAGWRWHLQQTIEAQRENLLKSLLIVGVIWAFWHTPTWLMYLSVPWLIPLDILDKMALAFIIGICYNRCRNLFVPMWIHFVANLVAGSLQIDVAYYPWFIALETVVAIGYILWYEKTKSTGDIPPLAVYDTNESPSQNYGVR